ncbi:MAG: thiamine pyrophosphate-dependent dehydrogenase E1 component subunit alpha [Chlamydiia bacterium]|nr:thiamine pyrophosphate-dependent dehydrogenase E1 component subunit alpha [Chlamydiia bacterium]
MDYQKLYEQMRQIRAFEERLFALFAEGKLVGTTHASIGQEAIAVSVMANLEKRDIVWSNHRCHAHFLARTGDEQALLDELMGKDTGVCGGRGGSQHLCRDNFYTNGVLGSTAPVATGMALAEKKKGSGAIVTLFHGDGAFGEGTIYEALNMMALWELPVLIVVENNGYAQSTPLSKNLSGTFVDRAKGFGIEADSIKSNRVEELYPLFKQRVEQVRATSRPFLQEVVTYRLCPHSKGDDDRPQEEIDAWKAFDPLKEPS